MSNCCTCPEKKEYCIKTGTIINTAENKLPILFSGNHNHIVILEEKAIDLVIPVNTTTKKVVNLIGDLTNQFTLLGLFQTIWDICKKENIEIQFEKVYKNFNDPYYYVQ